MRWISALAGGLVLLVALVSLGQVGEGAEKDDVKATKSYTVEMHDNEDGGFFKPKEITISVGDTVTWVNKGKKTHTATSDDDGKTFDTKNVKKGEKSKPIKFDKKGKVPYHCKPHDNMKGTIIVK